ncbi:hypothetical protein IWX64_002004 [Arthrobacter sp. CAN_A212]|uniref:hypothetical protein n=1 Tax=Arthrobacter sp. CAN_A212 TaxID=2787719 RepID=UPI0018C964FA
MSEVNAPGAGIVVALCAGHRCAALMRTAGGGGLADAVAHSSGGVLISAGCLQHCAQGAVAAVALRFSEVALTGPSVWLGGVESAEKSTALRQWVERWTPGQRAIRLPDSLADSVLGVGPPVRLESPESPQSVEAQNGHQQRGG